MIETTINHVGGVIFYSNIRILEPDGKRYGVPVHYISQRLEEREPEVMVYLKSMGLRKVGYTPNIGGGSFEYAQYPKAYIAYKVLKRLWQVYWGLVRFLYDNARFFKQIPEDQCFSWRYFTPYVWYKNLRLSILGE